MDTHFYFSSLRKTIIQFLDLFNNINIAKYKSDGTIIKYVKVPIKLAPKQKFHYWLNNRKNEKRFPMIGAYMEGIEPAANARSGNKLIKFNTNSEYRRNFVPYDINFRLTIATIYMNEADQILEQILPYFIPYVMVRIQIPEIDSYFDAKVILNGASPEIDEGMTSDENRFVTWSLDFLIHSYLVKPTITKSEIHDVYLQMKNHDFYENPSLSGSSLLETLHTSGYKDESSVIISNFEILNGPDDSTSYIKGDIDYDGLWTVYEDDWTINYPLKWK